jgi:dihydrofolate reductase
MVHNTPVIIVAGMSKEARVIGNNNTLLWHIPDDLKRFKRLTMGHPIIMGRKTFESIIAILGKPLPGRTNIVVTRNNDFRYDGVKVVNSLEKAFAIAAQENPAEIHIGGGSEIYTQALPYVDKIYVTWFFDNSQGDSHFPPFETDFHKVFSHPPQTHHTTTFQWVDYERK